MIVRWSALAHAKINLTLRVGGRRADGYHPVATVIQRLALHDRLEIAVEKGAGRGLEILVASGAQGVPADRQNLAGRAVELLEPELARAGFGGATVRIRIQKRIPVAAGLAGGSADAAAVLASINRRLGLGLGQEELVRRAAMIGSDVPACLFEGATLGTGRGEKVRPIAAPVLWWVLAHPGGALMTREVYQAYDASRPAPVDDDGQGLAAALEPLVRALGNPAVAPIARCLYNDLQEPACRLHRGIGPLLAAMMDQGALAAIVSGSGPTVAGLAPDARSARRIARSLSEAGVWTWWGPGQAS